MAPRWSKYTNIKTGTGKTFVVFVNILFDLKILERFDFRMRTLFSG